MQAGVTPSVAAKAGTVSNFGVSTVPPLANHSKALVCYLRRWRIMWDDFLNGENRGRIFSGVAENGK
jgi:hypothetical protein